MVQRQGSFFQVSCFQLLIPSCCRGRLSDALLGCIKWDSHRTGLKGFAKIHHQTKETLPKAENKIYYSEHARQGHKV